MSYLWEICDGGGEGEASGNKVQNAHLHVYLSVNERFVIVLGKPMRTIRDNPASSRSTASQLSPPFRLEKNLIR